MKPRGPELGKDIEAHSQSSTSECVCIIIINDLTRYNYKHSFNRDQVFNRRPTRTSAVASIKHLRR